MVENSYEFFIASMGIEPKKLARLRKKFSAAAQQITKPTTEPPTIETSYRDSIYMGVRYQARQFTF